MIEIKGKMKEGYEKILTPEALNFIEQMHDVLKVERTQNSKRSQDSAK